MKVFGTMKLSGLARMAAANSLSYCTFALGIDSKLTLQPQRDAEGGQGEHRHGDPRDAQARRAHRRYLAVRRQPPERQEDAGQHSERAARTR